MPKLLTQIVFGGPPPLSEAVMLCLTGLGEADTNAIFAHAEECHANVPPKSISAILRHLMEGGYVERRASGYKVHAGMNEPYLYRLTDEGKALLLAPARVRAALARPPKGREDDPRRTV